MTGQTSICRKGRGASLSRTSVRVVSEQTEDPRSRFGTVCKHQRGQEVHYDQAGTHLFEKDRSDGSGHKNKAWRNQAWEKIGILLPESTPENHWKAYMGIWQRASNERTVLSLINYLSRDDMIWCTPMSHPLTRQRAVGRSPQLGWRNPLAPPWHFSSRLRQIRSILETEHCPSTTYQYFRLKTHKDTDCRSDNLGELSLLWSSLTWWWESRTF